MLDFDWEDNGEAVNEIQDQYTGNPHADFLRYMDAEIARLDELIAKKERGEYVDPAPFIKELQRIGALDENGDPAWPYRDGD